MRISLLLALWVAGCVDLTPVSRRSPLGQPDGAAKELGPGCGSITYKGCCDGDTLRYCAAGKLLAAPCAPAHCGWDPAFGLYGCGSSSAADPAGSPRACPVADAGPAPADAARDASPDKLAGCAGVSYAGCCAGSKVYFCAGGKLLGLDCSKSPLCGWQAAQGYYDCGTAGQADPSGQHPLACGSLPPLDLGPGDAARERSADHSTRDGVRERGPSGDAARDGAWRDRSLVAEGRRDRKGNDAVGLDPSGLEVYRPDGGWTRNDGGCGCGLLERTPNSVPALVVLLLSLAAVRFSRRRPS